MEHPREADVGGEARLAARAGEPVVARRRAPDRLAGPRRPLLEWVLVDDDPDLLDLAFDLFLRANQSRHVRIASSIFGYVPQRQMFPAIR